MKQFSTSSDSRLERMAFTNILIKSGISQKASNDDCRTGSNKGSYVSLHKKDLSIYTPNQSTFSPFQHQRAKKIGLARKESVEGPHIDSHGITLQAPATVRCYTPKKKQSENQIFQNFQSIEATQSNAFEDFKGSKLKGKYGYHTFN